MKKTLSLLIVFATLSALGQSPARPDRVAPTSTSVAPDSPQIQSPQIQSPSLRVEFDKNMRSRVVARFKGKDVSLGPFSASETVKGSERSWSNFALASSAQERVGDVYGAGEKLTLVGTSGELRKNVLSSSMTNFPISQSLMSPTRILGSRR